MFLNGTRAQVRSALENLELTGKALRSRKDHERRTRITLGAHCPVRHSPHGCPRTKSKEQLMPAVDRSAAAKPRVPAGFSLLNG